MRTIRKIPTVLLSGAVVHGNSRGGSQLGFPTANLNSEAVQTVSLDDGVYCGFARIDGSPYMPMVVSIGWNPQFKDPTRTVEVHILQRFSRDFYGAGMDIDIRAHIREQRTFPSLEGLIEAIQADCDAARDYLATLPPQSPPTAKL